MSARRLPAEEYHRLADLPIAAKYGVPDPRAAAVIVVENLDGQIVGVWALVQTVCFEGLWVAPEYRRRTRVASKLLHFMKQLLKQLGVRHSFALIHYETPDVLALALKAGFQQLPWHVCLLDLEGDQ